MPNSYFRTRFTSLYGSQISPADLWMKNSVLRSRMTLVYWSQPLSVVLWIQNNDFSIRIASLCVPALICVFACKTATFWPELQVSIGPRPHLCFFALKTATLAPELQVSMDPSPHLCFFHTKQGLLDQNYKSLRIPDFTCSFVNAKHRD